MNKAVESRPRVLLVVRAIVLYRKKILLIRRSDNDTHSPSMWEFPGGKLDVGQDLDHAAEREVIEEAGLSVIPLKKLVAYDSFNITEGKYKGLPYVNIVGLFRSETSRVKISHEHQDFKWVSFDKALDMDLTEVSRKGLLDWEHDIQEFL